MSIKLNLGSGIEGAIVGYQNLDIKNGKPAYPLEIEPGTVDEIRASHLLEHFSHRQIIDVLKNWVQALRPGGILKIAVPDFGLIAERYLHGTDAERVHTIGYIMGGHVDKYDRHGALFDKPTLEQLLKTAGLLNIGPWDSQIKDCASLDISLNLQGQKQEASADEPERSEFTKINAVMSMPRLAFTENMFAAMRIVRDLGIEVTRGCGVFWGQVLTRMMEQHLDDGTEYILTVDYDTWFVSDHVIRLCQLMAENPQADIIVPIQAGRQLDAPLLGVRDDKGRPKTQALVSDFEGDLAPIGTGHFGLTLIRASALKKMQKPWFLPQPGPDGGWNEGRIDEDIYFWNNAAASGLKVFLANDVYIGHLQQVCTFCETVDKNWQPMHVYLNDLEMGKVPKHCKPVIELKK
jgi:predicted SAM-dependent methyltransferase